MNKIAEVRRAAQRWWISAERARFEYGVLGRTNADNTVTVDADRQDYVYVTMDTGTLTMAYNGGTTGVDNRAGLPVRVRDDAGRKIIDGVNTSGLLEGDSNAPSKVYSVNTIAPDSHGDVSLNLDDMLDVAAPTPADKDLLAYDNASSDWVNAATIPTPLAATIHAATGKTTPVDADELGLIDSAASNVLKKVTWANVKATLKTYFDTLYLTAAAISALATKNPPVDADAVVITDSAASDAPKRVTWANIKAAIKTYYDSVATTLTNKTLDSTNISTLTSKTTPVDADSVVIVDSAATNFFKAVTGTNLKAYLKTYFDTLYSALLGTYAAKTPPVDADSFVITDSAASDVAKRVTGTNVKAYLKTYFDTLYGLLASANTWTNTNAFNNSVSVTHSASALNVERTTASTTLLRAVAALKVTSSGSAADGFGPALFFSMQDDSASSNTIGEIGAVRSGADNSGDIVMTAISAGVAVEVARFLKEGKVAVGLTSVVANVLGIIAGTSSNDAAVGGVLYVDSGTHANTTTGETDLATYTVPAATLAVNNQSLRFKAWGTVAGNGNTKTIKVKFGSDVWTAESGAFGGAAATWMINGLIVRTGSATQDVMIEIFGGNVSSTPITVSTATRTLSGSNVLKLTGQGGATNDVLQEGFIVEWLDANT